MKNFVGIDLGTTNSAICTYDGNDIKVWKSPEQNDVTPSAIYFDKRGKHLGRRAYDMAPFNPDNAATLFKRLMGTSTPIEIPALGISKTPEECSAEILRLLFGYLPEEIRNDPETGTVITVPAAFNQMQKDATMQAADLSGIGMVALMQEPVAAVMSVMKSKKIEGMFLIYDLGGGTLDIAIAESINGRVNLLSHGGVAICGGRDFDRVVVNNVVIPWLINHFELPEDFMIKPEYKTLIRLAAWASEKAKIELSSFEVASISLSETETRVQDSRGNEIYLDVPLSRKELDQLIAEYLDESIEAARGTITKAGLSPHDFERIVFVGGPTNYKPLRDKVSFELGIQGAFEINPMTAVAEGAALFAESIDWSTKNRSRKNTHGHLSSKGGLPLDFKYFSRIPDTKTKIIVQVSGDVPQGYEFQVDSLDTGWTSGRLELKHGSSVEVTLGKHGENTFKVFVFDPSGGSLSLEKDRIIITRTAATVEAIPASHSIAVEVLDKLGGREELDYLVRAGDSLPKKGKKVYKAAETLKSGTSGSLNFILREGDIEDPIKDNRMIGILKIQASDLTEGVIPAGADLECEYEILDSGNITVQVSVPCIGRAFNSDKNFYSRQEGQQNFSADLNFIAEEGQETLNRINEISELVDDPKLEQARHKAESAISFDQEHKDTEISQKAMENVHDARNLLAQVRKDNIKKVRQIDLDAVKSFFDQYVRKHARPSETTNFDNLVRTAQRSIDRNDKDFENQLDELKRLNFQILWRQDWFVVERFKWMIQSPQLFYDKEKFESLVRTGLQFLKSDNIDKLRSIVAQLLQIQIRGTTEDEMLVNANILRG